MRLTQIKLAGFKSFVDPTVIPTPSELVGVVGPNGCGKSNIIDAVRWVLGETKASELRGASMQDVIFNGSGQRKPAARASVELVFDNSEGRAAGQWSSFAEIAVRRVLTRDGASSYFINNQQVRRRDIHDIFLGTGLGARGYAIIGQGMINRLIEARPEELRVYLEEAAGVSRYKERRRETENRLADTRENLTRLEDILRELSGQLEKLESQAEVAGVYRGLQDEGELKQHALWLLREESARASRQDLAVQTEQAQGDFEQAVARLRALEADLEARRAGHFEANDAVHQAQGRVFEAGALVSRLEAEIRHVVDARHRLQARRAQLQAQMQEWGDQQGHCQGAIEDVRGQIDEAAARAEVLAAQAEDSRERLPQLETGLREAAGRRDALRATLSRIEQDLALAAQAQRDADGQWRALDDRRARLEAERAALGAPDPAEIDRLEGECAVAQAKLEEAQDALAALEERLPGLEDARAGALRASQEARLDLEKLDARRQALIALQEKIQSEDALEPWLQRQELAAMGRLWQKLQVEPGWETALEAVLEERLGALGLRHLDIARAFAADAPPARLAFYQAPPAPAATASEAPAGARPLLALVRTQDPEAHALLSVWLRDAYVSDDLEQALSRRGELPRGACWVVSAGHRVDAHSVRFYAADSEQSGMLARRQQIDNLLREVKAAQLIADDALDAHARADAACRQVAQALGPARQRIAELVRTLHEAEIQHNRLAQQAAQSDEHARRIGRDLDEIAGQQTEAARRRDEAEARFQDLDESLAQQQELHAQIDLEAEELARRAEQLRDEVRERERAAQEAGYAARSLGHRLDELNRTLQLAAEQARRSGAELESLQGELFELDESVAQAGLQDALEARAECEEALRLARLRQDELAGGLREADEGRLALERSLDPLRARITELQLQEQAARLSVEQYAEQLDAREVDRAALRRHIDAQSPEWTRIGWLQSEVQRISRQLESLGPVNLAALDELGAARERKGFLDAQQSDLLAAIDTLEGAIRKIDRETRELLQQTFDTVNGHFGELFPVLFGGGEARLSMTGDEILDAGVQVMAQPPGKRNSSIHLLSGGEKALTATALVFALFKLNPAPFCLLDEVDAPLDDANTERYANLVRSMSHQTQFLFISHNKIAMQMARQLIGVTMQEQGVSRIVAVDMDSALQWAGEPA
ncbi:chromosome segregation protein SMC [Castellaniella sp. S9]|uniref:chromosome segregation protein SMC n=1 Tax=Castellaniella sp. S9 TaxID=2993652 RepID=UPI0022B5624A|nr:chromosome segregation protein SMC [Castellaniella sp. S9]